MVFFNPAAVRLKVVESEIMSSITCCLTPILFKESVKDLMLALLKPGNIIFFSFTMSSAENIKFEICLERVSGFFKD